jgi:hypothetical protein
VAQIFAKWILSFTLSSWGTKTSSSYLLKVGINALGKEESVSGKY